MALENLYRCSGEEIKTLYKDLTTAFFDDDLYVLAFPNESTRKQCMEFYFQYYIEAILPESYVLADSDKLQTIMVVCDSRKYQKKSYVWRLFKMNIKFLKIVKLIGIRQAYMLSREWDMFSSRWVKDFLANDYFHLDLIFTKEGMQKQGIASKMVQDLLDEAHNMDMDISVETHHANNVAWYETMGFVLMNTIIDAKSDLHQYCMIHRNQKES